MTCPDCGQPWPRSEPVCPSCGLSWEDVATAADFLDNLTTTEGGATDDRQI